MKLSRFVFYTHRILGTLLSILFLMWFVSGIVMMYHTYPSLPDSQRMAHGETLGGGASGATAWQQRLDTSLTAMAMQRVAGRDVVFLTDGEGEHLVDARTGEAIGRLSDRELLSVARRWSAAATLTDTLGEIDIWLIGAMPFKEYPIYHYALNDGKGSELYLSSRTGRALQLTDRESRFWAWVGAIPHWIYITKLRATGRQPWTDTVLWLSGLGIVMTLSGIVVSLRRLIRSRRRKTKRGDAPHTGAAAAPRRKGWAAAVYRWHHLLGLCFGLFVFTWIFSGFMSLADAPQLIWPTHEEHSARDIVAGRLQAERYALTPEQVAGSGDLRRMEWLQLGQRSFYRVWTADDEYLIDATDTVVRRTTLTTEQCAAIVGDARRPTERLEATMMDSYDNYYVSQKHSLPLPVCRVTVDDADRSTYYINPQTGDCRYYNTNRRAGKWMYSGLHALNFPFFTERPALRMAVMWALLLGGLAVSATGVVLAFRYLRRLLRRKKH